MVFKWKNMKKKVILIGYKGRLGSVFYEWLNEKEDRFTTHGVGREDDLESSIVELKPDLVIDLSDADSVFSNAVKVIQYSVPLIIGASGLGKNDLDKLRQMSIDKNQKTLHIPNFSFTAALMLACVKKCASFFGEVHILESHHSKKKDRPSQTAKYTEEIIKNIWDNGEKQAENILTKNAKGLVVQKKEKNTLEIASRRSSGLLAEQEVMFSCEDETLSIIAKTQSRSAFCRGLELSIEAIDSLPSGLTEGLETVLE